MNKFMQKAIVLTSVCIVLSGVGSVFAADRPISAGIKVFPVKVNVPATPGKKRDFRFSVMNTAPAPVEVSLEVQDFTRDEDGNYRFSADGAKPAGPSAAAGWIEPGREFRLAPGETRSVVLQMRPPRRAEPGTHSAMVFVTASPVVKRAPAKVIVGRARLGVMVRVVVKGKIIDKATLASVRTPVFNWGGPVKFDLVFANAGNVHKDIAGRITILKSRAKVEDIVVDEWTSLPGSKLNIKSQWSRPVFGSYQAKILLASRTGDRWEKSANFYVIPLKPVGAVVVLAAAGAWLWLFLKRRYSLVLEKKSG